MIAGFVVVGALLVAGAVQRRSGRLRGLSRGLLVSYITIVLLGLVGEAYFRFVYAESDGLPTLASRNWLDRYWHVNSLGFRDREWTPADWEGKTTVLVIGDSFAAGWGIAAPNDRFSGVLAAELGEDYAVLNAGKEGTATPGQIDILGEFPLRHPDVVIWQYYLNDIEDAALSIGLDPGLNPLKDVPAWATDSYMGSFLYWRLVSASRPEARGSNTYWDWLYSMYDHAVVWDIHREQIEAFINEVENRNARLIAVLFPNMLAPVQSIPYVDRVAQVLEARGYGENTIKLFDAAEGMPLAERIVSERDAHASAAFHRLVGEMLVAYVRADAD